MAILATNPRANFDYEILETLEAGVELFGLEVKSVRAGRMNLVGAFAVVKNNEVWLINAVIPPYQSTNTPSNYEPDRNRRLLFRAEEIKKMIGTVSRSGLTLIPLRMYTKGPRIKIALGLGRRKKKYDRRERIREREDLRKIERALKNE